SPSYLLLQHPRSQPPSPRSLHSFLSLLPPPPTSTLFPYTTLFRSFNLSAPNPASFTVSPGQSGASTITVSPLNAFSGTVSFSCVDRKSTRLNSSHRTISYAVFCLKKKKQTSVSQRHYVKCNDAYDF